MFEDLHYPSKHGEHPPQRRNIFPSHHPKQRVSLRCQRVVSSFLFPSFFAAEPLVRLEVIGERLKARSFRFALNCFYVVRPKARCFVILTKSYSTRIVLLQLVVGFSPQSIVQLNRFSLCKSTILLYHHLYLFYKYDPLPYNIDLTY